MALRRQQAASQERSALDIQSIWDELLAAYEASQKGGITPGVGPGPWAPEHLGYGGGQTLTKNLGGTLDRIGLGTPAPAQSTWDATPLGRLGISRAP